MPSSTSSHRAVELSGDSGRPLTLTQRRAFATLACYVALLATGMTIHALPWPAAKVLALGLVAPGVGFLGWWSVAGPEVAIALAALTAVAFGTALILWFATGNVILPPLIWLGSAVAASASAPIGSAAPGTSIFAVGALAALVSAGLIARSPRVAPKPPANRTIPQVARSSEIGSELSLGDLQLQRLLLDRALQPVEAFDGFEWRDQFQTAAIRYQLNFMSYALSLAQAQRTPAFTGYLTEAQRRLLRKQEDHRVWRYWALESAWGHLKPATDPMQRGNIMYSGFVAAQMAYARSAGALDRGDSAVDLRRPRGDGHRYTLDAVASLLTAQYRTAPWGLIACEPHWIYPLCNLISATALRAVDAQTGSHHWDAIEQGFRAGLEREFTTADGRLVPFRSSLTGLALPGAGGVVMQAFPCLFLTSLYPDLAEAHWARVRAALARQSWKRAFWPIDVGNYGFSRASNLAACAAAATEVGDSTLAAEILAYLDRQCPVTTAEGVSHRPRASLWAHALELMARVGEPGALCRLIDHPVHVGPHIDRAEYPAVLVAAAQRDGERLSVVLYPGAHRYVGAIGVAGLRPDRHYRCEGASVDFCRADHQGRATIDIALEGRSTLTVTPVI